MKRYYLSPVVGTGTKTDPYRAALQKYGMGFVAIIPSNVDGTPLFPWTFCMVNGESHTALLDDLTLGPFPDYSLDGRVNTMAASARAELEASLTKFALPTSLTQGNRAYREVIRLVGQRLEPDFSENNFDVGP